MRRGRLIGTVVLWAMAAASAALADAPPQRLPSAILVFPLISVEGGGATVDTRVELVNLTSRPVQLKCIYVFPTSCGGINFYLSLTPNQPVSWLASRGMFSGLSAVPPFGQNGELKCFVRPDVGQESIDLHNAIQGRAVVFGADDQTIGYSAVGFLRLTDGPVADVFPLDGSTYTQCPDEQHFVFMASTADPLTESEIILAPCSEDFANRVPVTTTVQFVVVNEFEQQLSASTIVSCYARRTLRQISHTFTRATLGTETGHIIVRGVQTPVLAMLVDRFLTPNGARGTAGNEPALRGGRSAEIRLP